MIIEILDTKKKYPGLYRFFSFLPGFLSLLVITLILSGYVLFIFDLTDTYSVFIFSVSRLILVYYLRWLIRGFEYIVFVFIAIFNLLRYRALRFQHILFGGDLTLQEKLFKKKLKTKVDPKNIVHRCIVPTYKEGFEILDDTIHHIEQAHYDSKRIAVTLAGEENDRENFANIAQKLENKYKNVFGFFEYTVHPKNMPGEIQGKGSNITYSAKQHFQKILDKFDVMPHDVVVTTLDSDTNIDKEYLNILTYTYLVTPDRKHKAYQPLIFFSNNFWQSPFFSKIISLFNSFWIIFNFLKKQGTRNFSTHAQSLDALIDTDFWSTQTIVEDGHQYRRSFFTYNGKYECVPMYAKVYQDCNQNKNYFLTAKAQYNQMRRRAHGAEDIPYVVSQMVERRKKLPFWRSLFEFIRLFEGIVLWSTLHIVLFAGMFFTFIKDVNLSSNLSLGVAISLFINLTFVNMLLSILLQLIFIPWDKLKGWSLKIMNLIEFLIYYFIFVGPVLLLFSGFPALHTQLSLMLGKPMKKFNVTEKMRT